MVTETAAICAYLADRFVERGLAPPPDSVERGRYYRYLFFPGQTLEPMFSVKSLGRGEPEPGRPGGGATRRASWPASRP